MKAKFIIALPDKYGKYVDYMYEYKNEQYFVRKCFAGNAMGESLREQHIAEQNRIDNIEVSKNTTIEEGTFDLDILDMFY